MTTLRTFVDFYTGEFADEETAISQVIDCAILSFPNEWGAVNGNIGTNIMTSVWRFQELNRNVTETLVRSALEPYKDWFRVVGVEIEIGHQISIIISVMVIQSRITIVQTVSI